MASATIRIQIGRHSMNRWCGRKPGIGILVDLDPARLLEPGDLKSWIIYWN